MGASCHTPRLQVTNDVFGSTAFTVRQFQHGGIAGLVGDLGGVAQFFDVVEYRELGSGVWPFSAHNQVVLGWPGGKGD